MKITKYLAISFGVLFILLATGWFLRNTLIERFSSPLLDEYDLRITDVSLDALATRDASISYLELTHANGAIIAIDDLTLPIRRLASGSRRFGASRVEITLAHDRGDELIDLAAILSQLLELPLQLPQTEIVVDEFLLRPYPGVKDLHWRFSGEQQHLTASIDPVSFSAEISQASDSYYLVNLSFSDPRNGGEEQAITADLQLTDTAISFDGSGTFDLHLWSPVMDLLGIDGIRVESGLATLRFEGEIAYDANQIPFVHAGLTPTTPLRLDISGMTDLIGSMHVNSASTTEISLTLTDLQWTLQQAQASLSVSDTYGNDVAVSLANFDCRSGPVCAGDVSIVADGLHLPIANVISAKIETAQELALLDESLQIRLRPDSMIALTGISGRDIVLAGLTVKLSSEGDLDFGDDGWRFTAQSIDTVIAEYAVDDGLTYSMTAFLDDVSASSENQRQYAKTGIYASGSHANWGGRRIELPGFRGSLSSNDNAVTVDLETDGLAVEAGIEASHDLGTGKGQLSLRHAGLSFDAQPLSRRFSPRPRGWDVIAGTIGFDLTAAWHKQAAEWKIDGNTSIRAQGLAGTWQDTAFTGLTTTVEAGFGSDSGLSMQPSTIELALLEIGVPIENISARYIVHPDEPSVDVAALRMSAFGGVVTADPFSFGTARDRNNITLHAASIDLAKILSIQEFEAIEISGKIGAELPVTIEGQTVTVSGGKLTGELPGGVIRYRSGTGQPDGTGIGFATRALSNFRYETLTSDVDYGSNGDLKLQMRLTGRNPDLDSNRPVILNLGVENNVPQMLRSLQAARAVEEILERRLVK